MSIKVCVLASGERIIADFYEVRKSPREPLGFVVVHPQSIAMKNITPAPVNNQTNEPKVSVMFAPWNPFAKRQFFKLNPDHVMTINDPEEDILEIYKEQFLDEDPMSKFVDETLEVTFYDRPSR